MKCVRMNYSCNFLYRLLLLRRRNPKRKCGIAHPESRLMSWLLTHLLLQLLQKVPRGGTISIDPTGRFNWNLALCWFRYFDFNHLLGPCGISFQTPLRWVLSQVTRSQRVRITRVRVQPKVHPTCQKLRAPRMLHPGQRFQACVLWRICKILNWLRPP
jgi:hypothetical protein